MSGGNWIWAEKGELFTSHQYYIQHPLGCLIADYNMILDSRNRRH